jgi:peptidoglycan hydrolase-like protein with peptidoglycan-binding domain
MFPQNHRFRAIAVKILALLCACVFLLAPATPTQALPQAFFHTQSLGNRGTDVKAIQYLLSISPSGVFDSSTESAVRNFQQAWGLSVDGIVGPATWDRLIVTVRYGNSGNAVRAVQTLLNEKVNARLTVNGTFDAATDSAVRNFQSHAQLSPVDGIVGPTTWKNLIWHYEPINFNQASVCPYNYWNGPDSKWGTAAAVGQMEAAANAMYQAGYGGVAIEALSLEHGGDIVNHSSHEVGLDVDIQVMRKDGKQCPAPSDPSTVVDRFHPNYDQARTRELIKQLRAYAPNHVIRIFFNDPVLINEGLTTYEPNHDDHLHVRYCEKVHSDSRYDC